jgi:diguanylate cyclase (GGDEF)-like protein
MIIDKLAKERIKYFSEYDTMTGALNRRAGFEVLNKIYQDFMKNKGNVSICFCDINGLKEVNDNLGHESGDEIILSVVNVINKNIRDTDYVVRLGGDEFLIIFVDSNIEQSENVWDKIYNEFMRINEVEDRKYIISASHGIEEFRFNADEYIDQIINLADEKMYNEKRIIKKDFEVLKKI